MQNLFHQKQHMENEVEKSPQYKSGLGSKLAISNLDYPKFNKEIKKILKSTVKSLNLTKILLISLNTLSIYISIFLFTIFIIEIIQRYNRKHITLPRKTANKTMCK